MVPRYVAFLKAPEGAAPSGLGSFVMDLLPHLPTRFEPGGSCRGGLLGRGGGYRARCKFVENVRSSPYGPILDMKNLRARCSVTVCDQHATGLGSCANALKKKQRCAHINIESAASHGSSPRQHQGNLQ